MDSAWELLPVVRSLPEIRSGLLHTKYVLSPLSYLPSLLNIIYKKNTVLENSNRVITATIY